MNNDSPELAAKNLKLKIEEAEVYINKLGEFIDSQLDRLREHKKTVEDMKRLEQDLRNIIKGE